jgi:hypothetical protein
MGDAIMTSATQQQQKFLAEAKQRIVHNLNDVDDIIKMALGEDLDMDPAGITIRDIFFNYQDKSGKLLIDAIQRQARESHTAFFFNKVKQKKLIKCWSISTIL